MRAAFTIIELVFIVLLLGILSVTVISRWDQSAEQLQAATDQIIRHIRYTQHLALIDDIYTPSPIDEDDIDSDGGSDKNRGSQYWFFKKWQIMFHADFDHTVYTIYSDLPSDSLSSNFDRKVHSPNTELGYENIATDPLTRLKLTGHHWDATEFAKHESYKTESLNLKDYYNISMLDVSEVQNKCGSSNSGWNAQIAFDSMGRPYCDNYFRDSGSEDEEPYDKLLHTPAYIRICLKDCNGITGEEHTIVCIEPITGYTHQVNTAADCQ